MFRKGKRKAENSNESSLEEKFSESLFVDVSPDDSDKEDATDSEESEFSGLEEEEDSSSEDDESVQSIKDGDESKDDADLDEENSSVSDDSNDGKERAGTSETIPVEACPSKEKDEYEQDSSDEEDIRNTVGNIPMEWYREYSHIGYDKEGRKLIKPKKGDELDSFLNKMDNPDYWRTVTDKMTGQDVILTEDDIKTIQKLRKGRYIQGDPYEPYIDFFTHETMLHPVTNRPEHKRSFIPSKWEKLKVGQMVHAIKMGWMKPTKPKDEGEDETPKYYMLWDNEDQSDLSKRVRPHMPAPKLPLPGHEESYNPPPEYLLTEEEELAWKQSDPEDRKIKFLPKRYSCLRHVPAFSRFINERFERCLDLYLCPRQLKMRMNVNPEDLLPKLPKPKDLQPFPTTEVILYKGHEGLVRCISVDPNGQWLVSGSDDNTVRFWEISTSRCMKTIKLESAVKSVAWNPNVSLTLVLVAVMNSVLIINTELGDKVNISNTDEVLNSFEPPEDESSKKEVPGLDWVEVEGKLYNQGQRLKVVHSKEISQVTWHAKGDYFATVMPLGEGMSVLIHQLSKRRSQNPFSKSKGLVQKVLFHPIRPYLFVATQRYVRVYNLVKQELSKKLQGNCKWISSIAIHPGGDNVIIGSYDSRLCWFDLDLSTKPYQTLRHHKKALRQVCYHRSYPLFASASDDGTVIVCHGMVYNDLLQNALIVPVKVLRGHSAVKDLGVLDCQFHPTQPWIFTSGADKTIRLYI